MTLRLRPALFVSLAAGYDRQTAVADLVAGITVGLVALPLAMAFAIASGLSPQAGIYCAVLTGLIVSVFGGSRTQIAGPTGAFVVVVAGIVHEYGVDGLFMCTMMAGVMLVVMGATGMGSAVRFIPRPVVVGFTNGIAVLIASTQFCDLLGLQLEMPAEFWPRMVAVVTHSGNLSPISLAFGLGTIGAVLAVNRLSRVPGSIVALIGGTIVAAIWHLPVDTIGTRFDGIPIGLPHVAMPPFHLALLPQLIAPAVTIALLGAIESLMSATVADRMSGDRHNSNVELIAQGLANIASPLVGGLPATGAIARTATNIRSGARTPISGIIHSVVLLVILLVAAPLAAGIPMAVLAGLLLVVAWNMGEWREIPELLRLTKTDIAVWMVTFGLTVFTDLTVAVEVGMVLAGLLFIRRVAETTTVTRVTDEYVRSGRIHSLHDKHFPPYVAVFKVEGPFLFGASDKLRSIVDQLENLPETVILRLRGTTALDATGLRAIEELAEYVRESGRSLILCGAKEQPASLIARADFHRHVGDANICTNISDALERARRLHDARQPTVAPAEVAGMSA